MLRTRIHSLKESLRILSSNRGVVGARVLTSMVLSMLAATVGLSGCGDAGAQGFVLVTPTCDSVENGAWESSPWDSELGNCRYLPFNGNTSYRIIHTLDAVPRSVELYVSFTADGESVAASAGDMGRILTVDDNAIEIANQTDADLFVRVVLR